MSHEDHLLEGARLSHSPCNDKCHWCIRSPHSFREAISQTGMALEESLCMEPASRMRISSSSMRDLESSQWQTLVQTQMAPNSSSVQRPALGWMASMVSPEFSSSSRSIFRIALLNLDSRSSCNSTDHREESSFLELRATDISCRRSSLRPSTVA